MINVRDYKLDPIGVESVPASTVATAWKVKPSMNTLTSVYMEAVVPERYENYYYYYVYYYDWNYPVTYSYYFDWIDDGQHGFVPNGGDGGDGGN